MNIYNFHSITKEYLTTVVAEADPAETKKQGKFIPLVPANATLIEPPIVEVNQVAVFENNGWVIKADYRKNYVKVNDNFQVQEIATIGEQEGFYVVDKAIGELIKENPNNFKIQDNQIVQKTETEIEQQKAQEEAERIAMLNLTGADVERAIYKAVGMDFDDIISLIEAQPLSETGKPIIDIKALKIELKANNFYRGSEWVNKIGNFLGFTSEQMDLFFETNDYTKLLPETNLLPDTIIE